MLHDMIQVLEQAVEKIRDLPADRQVYAAELLNALAAQKSDGALTVDEIDGVEHAQAQTRRREFADEKVAAFYERIGL